MAMTPMAVFASSNMPDTNTKSNVDSVDGVVQDEVFVVAKRTRATPAKSAKSKIVIFAKKTRFLAKPV